MSLCSTPLRVRRSVSLESSQCSSPLRESTQQLLVSRRGRRQFKGQSVLQRSITMSGKKLSKVRSIVRHWKKLAHHSQSQYSSLTGEKEATRLESSSACFSSSSCSSSDLEYSPKSVKHLARSAVTADVPDGCLALFVGREKRRFVIGAHYLEHNLFRGLLERSAAEFGFEQKGGINIACEVVLFEHLLWLIGTDDPSSRHLQVDELLDFYAY